MNLKKRIRKLQDRFGRKTGLPKLVIFHVSVAASPRDEMDNKIGPPRALDSHSLADESVCGAIDDVWAPRVRRLPGETIEQFQDRLKAMPHRETKFARQIFLFPHDEPNEGTGAPGSPQTSDRE